MGDYEELLLGVAAGSAQGVFEWLPVSSKTILLLIFYWAGFKPSAAYVLGLFLNGSTAAAAIAYFRRDVLRILKAPLGDPEGVRLLKFLLASMAATGVVALPLAALVAESLERLDRMSMLLVGALYLIMSVLLWRGREGVKRAGVSHFDPYRDGFLAGLAQGLSAIPGVSRSGITILALLALGRSPQTALRLSFLMSIPATLGGSAYALILEPLIISSIPGAAILAASITAIALSMATISGLLSLSRALRPHLLTAILAAVAILAALVPARSL